MVAAADQQGPEPEPGADASVLAERRARRAELAEGELRGRLADAERRVAQLEHVAHEAGLLRERLAARAERDSRMAALVADAAATLRAAREALDREIAARSVAEAALHAERAAREAAEQAVLAERAARDAATSALTAERARAVQPPSGAPVAEPAPALPPALAPAPALPRDAGGPDNEQLIAGLALAAERLRAQAEQAEQGAAAEVPAERAEPQPPDRAGGDAPAVAAEVSAERAESQRPAEAPAPWRPRPGGLIERLGRALARRR